ncbi:hypothetical protein N7533_003038 [Penicillium manginii]|jgi:hypothetical protein|uniref:uncharacterized protein n=1 Tax=Penicillium manginii TaxID=203109 RepID=UPI00254706C6|nr:uncharacterized protein N7533_003038 [Penicillium manginii]KAJ5764357.1 hypothetical protein N7533_003038 [Penicillium manginii]
MKAFIALGALAALCHSAFGLDEGAYTIGSASLQSNKILSVNEEDGQSLSFSPNKGDGSQTWYFTRPDFDNNREFLINSTVGGYLNCPDQERSLCILGGEPQIYTAELANDNTYELISKQSGYFLRADGDNIQIAAWDQSPDEQFVLTPTEN